MAISVLAHLRRRLLPTTLIHVMALDGIINVNSLFSVALFLGLTTTGRTTSALAERVVSSHVYSFSSFMFSSLVALALKQSIKPTSDAVAAARGFHVETGRVSVVLLRVGILGSGMGSVFGCGFLVWALVDLVQIKLGPLGCVRDFYSLGAIVPLVVLVPSALAVYVFLVLYAFTQ
ncbi:PREDICTED: uncharacterized protein LOC104814891 [Tarenaya hassleriana]|uniref:uncharacterized protein LOC104814891 n=1 Tax=Tarenaya hassleriana TaxID=28532 RepID=UPI00053C9EEB|nr:PREDICTED: uncharacterized protein LOC104814891 [Tarenaya hassleriana]